MFIIEWAIRGSADKWQIHTQWSHFWRLAVTVDFDDISLGKYGHLIIWLEFFKMDIFPKSCHFFSTLAAVFEHLFDLSHLFQSVFLVNLASGSQEN